MNATIRSLKLFILLFAVTISVYLSAFWGSFHYDDSLTILENPHLSDWHTFIGHLDHMVRPVLYASFFVDRSLFGMNPVGYHLFNLLLHLGSGLLIYLIATRAVTEETNHVPGWTALLFLVHPIATETVTYISGRASGLMAFLSLFALFLYIRADDRSESVTRHRLYLSGAVASFILAIGSKETAITLPIILLLWDVVIRKLRGPFLRTVILARHLPFWIVLLLAAGWAWSHPRYHALAQFSLEIRPLWDHLLSELHAMAYAATLLFTPWNQNFDHDLPALHSLTQWPLPLNLLVLSVMVAVCLFSRRRFPLVAFGLAWFFIQLLPTSLIPRNDLLSERNLYLPAIGLLLAIVALSSHVLNRLMKKNWRPTLAPSAWAAAGTVVVILLCFFTVQRNQLYHDRLLLWSDAVDKSPHKARPHNNLGYAYALQDDWDRAIEEFRKAARLDPDFILAQQNLRDAYLHRIGRQ